MQLPMFYETYEDAIRDTITGLGGMKVVGNMLWPALPVEDAGRRLAHCLNSEKREKLSPGELQLIRRAARKAGIHILAFYECRDAGYAEPTPVNPADEAAQLQKDFIAAVERLKEIQDQLAAAGRRSA